MIAPQLRPLTGMTSAPVLTVRDGQIILAPPGKPETAIGIGGPGKPGVAALARYETEIVVPTDSPMHTRRRYRSGWRLLDGAGNTLIWLANSEQEAYDRGAAEVFARDAGIALRDLGFLDHKALLADRGMSMGPGTTVASSFVAPARQWAMAAALLGGILVVAAPFMPLDSTLSGGKAVGFALSVFFSLFIGVLVAQPLGIMQAIWRERRYYAKHPARGLRSARRTPGVIITADADRVYVRDYARTWEGPRASTVLTP